MKTRGYLFLIGFAVFLMIVGIACNGGATPTAQPVQINNNTNSSNSNSNTNANTNDSNTNTSNTNTNTNDSNTNTSNTNTSNSSTLVTFTDQNKFYKIDVPGNWKHDHTKDSQNNYYYIDTFTSPDGNAVIENIAYDDGTAFAGSDEATFGLKLLNTFYSKTGKEGDIKVTEEKAQSDGSDRLTWYSKAGGYTGFSYLEIRNGTTFLMFTVNWNNDFKDTYLDTLNKVIASYIIP